MSVEQLQREVSRLPEAARREFAAWMVAQFPPRSVENLVARAEQQARRGEWIPRPPEPDNFPSGAALEAAVQRAKTAGVVS